MQTLFHGAYTNRKTRRSGIGLIPGLIAAIVILFLAVSLTAVLTSKGTVKPDRIPILSKILYVIAMTVGCFTTAKKARSAKLVWTALSGAFTCAVVLVTAGLTCGFDNVQIGLPFVLTVIAIFAGGILGAREKRSHYL